jgi:integrase
MSVRKRTWRTARGETKHAFIVDYFDQEGDRHQEAFQLKKDATDFHATVRVDVKKGLHTARSKSPTVIEAAESWLKLVEANGMKGQGPAERSTLRQYRQHIDLHIVPRVGRMKLAELTTKRVEAFRDDLLAALSRPLARKVLTSFKSMLKVANCGHITHSVSIGSDKRNKPTLEPGRDIPTPDEIKRLIAAVSDDDLKRRALLLTVAFTGLRASELRGLRWRDVDLKAGEFHVRRRADRYNKIGSPKSKSSVRTLPLDDVLKAALKTWKMKSEHSGADDYVFCTGTGQIEHHKNMLRSLIPVMKAAHLLDKKEQPKYGLHSFRHFFASWCINSKDRGGRELPPKAVQYLLGHSSITMTFDIYGHMFTDKGDRSELNASVRQLLA